MSTKSFQRMQSVALPVAGVLMAIGTIALIFV